MYSESISQKTRNIQTSDIGCFYECIFYVLIFSHQLSDGFISELSFASSCLTCVAAGKDVLYNIVSFARDSVRGHVTTLRPDNFPTDRQEPWLVDFFVPVCNNMLYGDYF